MKILAIIQYLILLVAAVPLVYYLLAIYSTFRFFEYAKHHAAPNTDFLPPVSLLKPIKGLDEDAYENYASFCRQDYPEYELVFCVDPGDPALPLLEKLQQDFPERDIRLLMGSGRRAVNDKIARLARLTSEAKYDIFIITDGDVRVRPDYLRAVVSPFRNPKLGAATCFYMSTHEKTFLQALQSISMTCDFFAGILVGWKLDGVKFTLSQSILTTRKNIEGFGGYMVLENRPADDLYIGRLAAEQGLETDLVPYTVETVADFHSMHDLFVKRLRWMTVMRHMRPWGHVGLLFTWGLPWSLIAIAVHPTAAVAAAYLGAYLLCRTAMTWLIGVKLMNQPGVWKKMPLVPVWDAVAFCIWVASFLQRTIRWRGVDYFLRNGELTPVISAASGRAAR